MSVQAGSAGALEAHTCYRVVVISISSIIISMIIVIVIIIIISSSSSSIRVLCLSAWACRPSLPLA